MCLNHIYYLVKLCFYLVALYLNNKNDAENFYVVKIITLDIFGNSSQIDLLVLGISALKKWC